MPALAPEAYQPPLTRWGHVWRTLACLAISGIAWGPISADQWQHYRVLFWIDLAVGLASFPLVFFRRRWPFAIAMILALTGFISGSSAGPGTLAVVSFATQRRVPRLVVVAATAILASWAFTLYEPNANNSDPRWLGIVVSLLFAIAVCALGMYIGSRRELIWTLKERAREAEAERDLRVGQAQSAERERIAREMHDVLAHRISLVTMHAGALAYRTDLPPEQVRETARLIQTKAHEALADLRQVLGVLRGDEGVALRPQPTLADVGSLLGEAREGGMIVDLADSLDGRTPPEQVGRTLYRIVQEALTNARKHAPGTHVQVRLDGDTDAGVTVTVRNGKPVGGLGRVRTPGSGLGLVGLRERTALAGGTLDVEDTTDAFVLRGWLPWTL